MQSKSKKLRQIVSLVMMVVCLVAFQQFGIARKHLEKRIDDLIEAYTQKGQFSGTVLVTQGEDGNDICYAKAFGLANREGNIPNTMDTKMLIGSNTKQFTALLVMQEVENGNIDLNGVIGDYLPGYNGEGKDVVTIHQMLSMHSQIPNYTTNPDYTNLPAYPGNSSFRLHYNITDFVDRYCSGDLTPPNEPECPGSLYEYSNSNYYILGLILETITGKPYAQLVRERIFEPLGMNNSGYYTNEAILNKMASGYNLRNATNTTTRGQYIDVTNMYTTGGVYSTAEDLNRWYSSLYTSQLLSDTYRQQMMQRHILICPNDAAYYGITLWYGYGFQVGTMQVEGRILNVVLHGGSVPDNFRSFHIRVLDDKYTVIVLSNTHNEDLMVPAPYDIAINVTRALYLAPPEFVPHSLNRPMRIDW